MSMFKFLFEEFKLDLVYSSRLIFDLNVLRYVWHGVECNTTTSKGELN
jgi:hypothetical protein